MSTVIITDPAEYTHNLDDWNPLNNDKWYYKLETTITGTDNNINPTTKILRSKTMNGEFVSVGTFKNNKITLNSGAKGNEKDAVNNLNETWDLVVKNGLYSDLKTKIGALDLSEKEKKKIEKGLVPHKIRRKMVSFSARHWSH